MGFESSCAYVDSRCQLYDMVCFFTIYDDSKLNIWVVPLPVNHTAVEEERATLFLIKETKEENIEQLGEAT